MAPEVFLDQPVDLKADIWSLGIILYALICSRFPFPSKTPYSDAAFERVSPICVKLLKSMLEVNVEQRLSIEDVLSHAWLNQ